MSDALLAAYDAVLFDLDGTVYHGTRVIPGAPETVRAAREHGTPVRFVTNNASKAPAEVVDHLTGLGMPADAGEVHTSAQAGVQLLKERLEAGAEVLVVGTESLAAEVTGAGLKAVRENARSVQAVVQGHSPDNTWAALAEACLAIRAGALWVACNVDATLPSERGLLPGNGSMVAALRTATDVEPLVAGKPEPLLFETAARSAGAEKPLVVGDRLDTDIAGAVAAGIDSLVVLSGVATPEQLIKASPAERGTYLAKDLTAMTSPADDLRIGPRPGWTVTVENGTLTAKGDGDDLDLLRALCHVAWETGVTELGEDAKARLA
ncbi:HAD-superfamily subfamily IIA hydrolase, TIGR01457 [Amycolatopsis pretoriensis]|uniref:HAD-superfamily subfamily IIA hydrolase, TIGR01457 n=1 Tax=Amycolatopsis pretoriensis TaxID=218821 RepID=A0A1H5QJ05_9PSEU|nr:HAD-IIA family hydrolase [Amycolatopsis pretoriensis]SEF25348.1 HAD-superfamily subfamily IIA hydrolase, TIGR01457 [Amycolatopsis pretoriensis]